eukprot:Clim_evm89s156 gene=Clim_evmTU89s156
MPTAVKSNPRGRRTGTHIPDSDLKRTQQSARNLNNEGMFDSDPEDDHYANPTFLKKIQRQRQLELERSSAQKVTDAPGSPDLARRKMISAPEERVLETPNKTNVSMADSDGEDMEDPTAVVNAADLLNEAIGANVVDDDDSFGQAHDFGAPEAGFGIEDDGMEHVDEELPIHEEEEDLEEEEEEEGQEVEDQEEEQAEAEVDQDNDDQMEAADDQEEDEDEEDDMADLQMNQNLMDIAEDVAGEQAAEEPEPVPEEDQENQENAEPSPTVTKSKLRKASGLTDDDEAPKPKKKTKSGTSHPINKYMELQRLNTPWMPSTVAGTAGTTIDENGVRRSRRATRGAKRSWWAAGDDQLMTYNFLKNKGPKKEKTRKVLTETSNYQQTPVAANVVGKAQPVYDPMGNKSRKEIVFINPADLVYTQKKDHPSFLIAKAVKEDLLQWGELILKPGGDTMDAQCQNRWLYGKVEKGKVEVTIADNVQTLASGMRFRVPPANRYRFVNQSKTGEGIIDYFLVDLGDDEDM